MLQKHEKVLAISVGYRCAFYVTQYNNRKSWFYKGEFLQIFKLHELLLSISVTGKLMEYFPE